MNIRSNLFFARRRAAACALAISLVSLGATAASAQWFNWDDALPPMRVERMIAASGYRLTGPVIRNGEVYLANVLGREDDRERLVIDARDGRLLRRFAAAPRQRFAGADWSAAAPRSQGLFGGFFDREDRDDDFPARRPPANVYGDAEEGMTRVPLAAPETHPHAVQNGQVARAEDATGPSNPTIIMAPPAASSAPSLEKPRAKPQVKHSKPAPAPVAQPATPPENDKPTPVAALPPANLPPTHANPHVQIAPSAPNPIHKEAVREPAPAAPSVADSAKASVTPTPEPAAAPPPAPKAVASKPTVNDVPVAPLE